MCSLIEKKIGKSEVLCSGSAGVAWLDLALITSFFQNAETHLEGMKSNVQSEVLEAKIVKKVKFHLEKKKFVRTTGAKHFETPMCLISIDINSDALLSFHYNCAGHLCPLTKSRRPLMDMQPGGTQSAAQITTRLLLAKGRSKSDRKSIWSRGRKRGTYAGSNGSAWKRWQKSVCFCFFLLTNFFKF